MNTSSYLGKYSTNGKTCNCLWFAAYLFCRNIIFYRKKKGLVIYTQDLFHKSFQTNRFKNKEAEAIDEDDDLMSGGDSSDNEAEEVSAPASPGMEHLLHEQSEANKKLPKNVKYNEAFDVVKLCAEYLKNTPNQMFKFYLNAFKSFALQLRDGLSLEVLDFLANPSAFELKKVAPDVSVEEDEEDSIERSPETDHATSSSVDPSNTAHEVSSSMSSPILSAGILHDPTSTSTSRALSSPISSAGILLDPPSSSTSRVSLLSKPKAFKCTLREVPENLDCLIKKMPGDGSCLFCCGSDWLFGGVQNMKEFRKQAHRFIVENWDYYYNFICLPFNETIGVGSSARPVEIKTYEGMKKFLLSDDSLYCFSNSSLDLSNMANMYDMRIAIFTYSSRGTVAPHWTWVDPDPNVSSKSPYRNKLMFREMWLFHEDNVPYDLLVLRPTPPPAPFSSYIPPVSVVSDSTSSSCLSSTNFISEAASTLNEISEDEISEMVTVTNNDGVEAFSPMNFMHCGRGVGRPKLKRFGAPSLLKSKRKAPNVDFIDGNDEQIEPSKKRAKGRPKGSKNKPKDAPVEKPHQSLRERAEAAAYVEQESDACNICLFRFDDPLKKDIALSRCTECNVLVHEPCLIKNGCISDLCFLNI